MAHTLDISPRDHRCDTWRSPELDPREPDPCSDPWGGTPHLYPAELGRRRIMGLNATGYRWIAEDRTVEAWVASEAPEPLASYHRLAATLGLVNLPQGVRHWPSIILERGTPLRVRIHHHTG